jgi:hypothetical protein
MSNNIKKETKHNYFFMLKLILHKFYVNIIMLENYILSFWIDKRLWILLHWSTESFIFFTKKFNLFTPCPLKFWEWKLEFLVYRNWTLQPKIFQVSHPNLQTRQSMQIKLSIFHTSNLKTRKKNHMLKTKN